MVTIVLCISIAYNILHNNNDNKSTRAEGGGGARTDKLRSWASMDLVADGSDMYIYIYIYIV